ncbi:hypothetical protein, partial [Mycobacterium tuberculosis]
RMCRKSIAKLEQNYTRPAAYDHTDYANFSDLDHYIDTVTLRSYAFSLEKCPNKYQDIEIQALIKVENGTDPYEVRKWMQNQIEKLPSWTLIPDVPHDFKVEEFILKNIQLA